MIASFWWISDALFINIHPLWLRRQIDVTKYRQFIIEEFSQQPPTSRRTFIGISPHFPAAVSLFLFRKKKKKIPQETISVILVLGCPCTTTKLLKQHLKFNKILRLFQGVRMICLLFYCLRSGFERDVFTL